MPSRNIVKEYAPASFYHAYNRGVEKRVIFNDEQDHIYFLYLLKRQLSTNRAVDSKGREFKNYYGELELVAFCLMPNHFHMLIYQNDNEVAISAFMQSLLVAYTGYFNRKYDRVGGLFQSCFKAVLISNDAYLLHISRYIHLNPKNYEDHQYSSLPYYTNKWNADWVKPQKILDLFEGSDYVEFLKDHVGHRAMLKEIKHELANPV